MAPLPLAVALVAIIACRNHRVAFRLSAGLRLIVVIVAGAFRPAIIGWISLVIGALTLAVGVGLWRSNPAARTIATIVFVINIVFEVLGMSNGDSR